MGPRRTRPSRPPPRLLIPCRKSLWGPPDFGADGANPPARDSRPVSGHFQPILGLKGYSPASLGLSSVGRGRNEVRIALTIFDLSGFVVCLAAQAGSLLRREQRQRLKGRGGPRRGKAICRTATRSRGARGRGPNTASSRTRDRVWARCVPRWASISANEVICSHYSN